MSPNEREFGELIAKVDGVGQQIEELRRTGTSEHEANARKLERIEARIDSLESLRDKFGGAKAFLAGVGGAALTLLGIVIGH